MSINMRVCDEWLAGVSAISSQLHPDLLFSPVGCYDLTRITLSTPADRAHPAGTTVWGPVPAYVADREMWSPINDPRPRKLSAAEFDAVDWKVFWHCAKNDVLAAFGIFEGDSMVAMATVAKRAGGLMEVGVDVVPGALGRQLGSAVVSAAGNWVLDNGGVIYATAAAWNVPSSRNLRRLGMEYAYSALVGEPAPFKQPPQPLGAPLPGAAMINRYPEWAMNKDIRPSTRT
jgi:RimJ/RimL family protein N-acetyltransferase